MFFLIQTSKSPISIKDFVYQCRSGLENMKVTASLRDRSLIISGGRGGGCQIILNYRKKLNDPPPFHFCVTYVTLHYAFIYPMFMDWSVSLGWLWNCNVVNQKASFLCTLYIYIYLYIVTVWYLAKCMTSRRRHFFRVNIFIFILHANRFYL